jgi:hypothetical protein
MGWSSDSASLFAVHKCLSAVGEDWMTRIELTEL